MNAHVTPILINRTTETVADDILAARKTLQRAQNVLDDLQDELVAMIDTRAADDEGSKTYTLDGFKVEVKRSLNRKPFDKTSIDVIAKLGLGQMTPLKVETKLDDTGIKYLKANEPTIYAKIARHITAKPAKVGVTVTRTE